MKTKNISRMLALVLCLCLTASLFPVTAGAAGETEWSVDSEESLHHTLGTDSCKLVRVDKDIGTLTLTKPLTVPTGKKLIVSAGVKLVNNSTFTVADGATVEFESVSTLINNDTFYINGTVNLKTTSVAPAAIENNKSVGVAETGILTGIGNSTSGGGKIINAFSASFLNKGTVTDLDVFENYGFLENEATFRFCDQPNSKFINKKDESKETRENGLVHNWTKGEMTLPRTTENRGVITNDKNLIISGQATFHNYGRLDNFNVGVPASLINLGNFYNHEGAILTFGLNEQEAPLTFENRAGSFYDLGGTLTLSQGTTFNGPPPVYPSNATVLPTGTEGQEYNAQLYAENSPNSWSIHEGSLPDGLMINQNTGVISGTPSECGSFTFGVTIGNDRGSRQATLTLSIDHAGFYNKNPLKNVSLNTSVVGFAGREWLAIGMGSQGVNSGIANFTLLSKASASQTSFSDSGSTAYADSKLRAEMEKFYTELPADEKALVKARVLNALDEGDMAATLEGEHYVWPLSSWELSSIDVDVELGESGHWWLRTTTYDGAGTAIIYTTDLTGILLKGIYGKPETINSMLPALTLNACKVLFTSPAAGAGPAASETLTAYTPPTGPFKLTVYGNENLYIYASDELITADSGETVSISYDSATSGEGKSVSALLLNADGDILYYGRLVDCSNGNAEGNARFTVPADLANGKYQLLLFSEQENGNNRTNFAGTPVSIDLQVGEAPTVGFAGRVWHIIGENGAGVNAGADRLTLFSKENLQDTTFGSSSEYENSTLHTVMNNYYTALNPAEKSLVLPRTLDQVKKGGDFNATLAGQHVWPISEREAHILPDAMLYNGTEWWMRSATNDYVHAVALLQNDYVLYYRSPEKTIGARPALTIDTSRVLMTAPADGTKPAFGSALTAYTAPEGTYKLTVKSTGVLKGTGGLTLTAANTPITADNGQTVSIPYTNAATGAGRSVSALLRTTSGSPLYYGRLVNCATGNAEGAARFTVPNGLADGQYQLLLFSEQANGKNKTDFASEPVVIAFTVGEAPRETYSVTVAASPAEGGTVSGGGNYLEGKSVTVEANAADGYVFVRWTESGETVSDRISYSFEATGHRELTAEFAPATRHAVTVVNGTGSGMYMSGETAYIKADPPAPGKRFKEWTSSDAHPSFSVGSNTTANAGYRVSGKVTLTATYEALPTDQDPLKNHYSITVLTEGRGTAYASVNSAKMNQDGITLTADPEMGYRFRGWRVITGGDSSLVKEPDKASTELFMPGENVTVKAVFVPADTEEQIYNVIVSGGQGTGNYAVGETVTITANEPPQDHYFKNWQVDVGGAVLADESAFSTTFTMPANNVEITAHTDYKDPQGSQPENPYYSIAVLNDANGTATADKNRARQNDPVALTATPNTGYRFKEWQVVEGGITVQNNGFTMPAADVVVRATFEPATSEEKTYYTVSLTANPAAGGTVDGAGRYEANTYLSVQAKPNNGYTFLGWSENGQTVSTSELYAFTLTGNRSLTAEFGKLYLVTVNNGTGSGDYAAGKTVTIKANEPAPGKYFTGWTVNSGGITLQNQAETSFTMPENDVEVTAVYGDLAANEYSITVKSNGNGTAKADKIKAKQGDPVSLTAKPNAGYRFKEWTISPDTVTITNNGFAMPAANVIVTATFELIPKYTVTVKDSYAAVTGAGRYEAGVKVTINAGSRNGFTFDGWTVERGGVSLADSASATTSFTMPERGVAVRAKWRAAGGDTPGGGTTNYTITATAGQGGSISPDGQVPVAEGTDKTFTVTPDKGYRVSDVLVDGKSVGAVHSYTFKNVRQNHTIEAVFAAVVADPEDTGVSAWLETDKHIAYLQGYPGGIFGPDRNMTRAEVAQMFYNLLLDKDVAITAGFDDVADGAWYAQAVRTLASLEIVEGVGGGLFEPDRPITRAEFTAAAMRFAKLPTGGENIFSDVPEDAWYHKFVVGAIQYGWITGYPDGTFRPDSFILRSEVATIVNRMLGRFADKAFIDANSSALKQFGDLTDSHWAYYDIMEAANGHKYTGKNGSESWNELMP